MRLWSLLAAGAACVTLWSGTVRAERDSAANEAACNMAIEMAEKQHAVPKRVLGTIAAVESGRAVGRKIVPWPWAINVDGASHYLATKAEAIAAVQAFRAAGARSIDVGCMQINLAAHPQAFSTLDDAFDPAANTSYAARFLRILTQQTGRIAIAMTAYHSQTPEFAADYARRLLAIWPGAAALGLTAPPAIPVPPTRPELPSPYTAAFAAQIARDRITLNDRKSAPASRLGLVSSRGAGWPARSGSAVSPN